MANEIRGIPGGNSVISVDFNNKVAGNDGVAIKAADGSVKAGDIYDLSTLGGQKAYLAKLQSLGIGSSDLPSFVTNMEANGFVAGLSKQALSQLKALAASVSDLTKAGAAANTSGAQGQWADFISRNGVNMPADVNALIEMVLRESYLETNKDLAFYAQKVRFYNDVKKQIRAECEKARNALKTVGSGEAGAAVNPPFTPAKIDTEFYGQATANTTPGTPTTTTSSGTTTPPEAPKTTTHNREADTWVGPSKSYNGSKEYSKFDEYASGMSSAAAAYANSLTPEEQEALMAQIVADGGVTVNLHCSEHQGTNNTYNESYTIVPRAGESLPDFLARAATEAGASFRSDVRDKEGTRIKIDEISGGIALPGFSFTTVDAPVGTGTGSSSSAYQTGADCKTKGDLDTYIKNMEEKLNSVGDDAQLANVDLQNMLQKQQQTLQMMSNISKMLHDTALAIIRKIGG